MPAEQSSLQSAMNRIMGAPAGGTPQEVVQLAAKTPYSALPTDTPTTQLSISNTPFDPYAEQAAQLEAMKAQTAALQSQIAGMGTTGTAAPTATGANPWDLPAAQASISKGFFYDPDTGQVQVGDMWGSTAGKPMQVVSPTNINDPGVYRTLDWSIGTRRSAGYGDTDPATAAALKLLGMASSQTQKQAFEDYGKYYYSTPGQTGGPGAKPAAAGGQAAADAAEALRKVATGPGGKPINPGPRAPWQASAQYWKDLEAYKRAGGT